HDELVGEDLQAVRPEKGSSEDVPDDGGEPEATGDFPAEIPESDDKAQSEEGIEYVNHGKSCKGVILHPFWAEG
ncbi:MAG: hypothetical protein DRG33_06845, partial [Deltaproteobacteria bacterium]